MPFKEMLEKTIAELKEEGSIQRLKTLRDSGLDKIINDPDVKTGDFDADDKQEFVILINQAIVDAGGEV